MKNNFVLGFLFSEDLSEVVLIKKEHPEWQKGKLNGVGGTIREGESTIDAMVREFSEETGVLTNADDWKQFCSMGGDDSQCECFCSAGIGSKLVSTTTDEEVVVRNAYEIEIDGLAVIPNVRFLVKMAQDKLMNPYTYKSAVLRY